MRSFAVFFVSGALLFGQRPSSTETIPNQPVPVPTAGNESSGTFPRTASDPHNHTRPEYAGAEPSGGGNDLRDSLIAGGLGFFGGLLAGRAAGGNNNPEKLLSDRGPQFPSSFSMSTITVQGFVKGNWPCVIDYELRRPGIYLITVAADGVEPYTYLLDSSQIGRRQQRFVLPARFGDRPRPGLYGVRALENVPGELRPVYLRVFGLGAGERAVGSIAIDQLQFTPAALPRGTPLKAQYGFHSHADFEKATAEFERVGLSDGAIVAQLEDKADIKEPVRRETAIAGKEWDARKAKAQPGQHLLQVRAWYTLKNGADWVMAWSPQLVKIEE